MSNIVRWDPFTDMRATMDRLFDDSFARPRRRVVSAKEFAVMVPVEVSETESAIEVKASLPGTRPEEVEVTVHDDILTIKAEHKEATEELPAEGEAKADVPTRQFYRREIRYGAFHRSFSLPSGVDANKAEARFENGVLHLILPKAEANRPHRIKVAGAPDEVTAAEG